MHREPFKFVLGPVHGRMARIFMDLTCWFLTTFVKNVILNPIFMLLFCPYVWKVYIFHGSHYYSNIHNNMSILKALVGLNFPARN